MNRSLLFSDYRIGKDMIFEMRNLVSRSISAIDFTPTAAQIADKHGVEGNIATLTTETKVSLRIKDVLNYVYVFVSLCAFLLPARSQETPRHEAPIRTTTRLVLVPATVRDKSGQFVSEMKSEDFKLTDNGVMQSLRVEQTKGQAVALVVVMQTGDGASREFQNYQTLTRLLKIADPETLRKVAFVTFDSKPRQIWNFPVLRDGVQYAMNHPENGDRGAAIVDAVDQALKLLGSQPAEMRKMILLLSQPQDDGSHKSFWELARQLGESNVTLYSVTFPQAITTASKASRLGCNVGLPLLAGNFPRICEETALQLSTLSGGEHVAVKKRSALDRSVAVLRDAFLNSYLLSFRPTSPAEGTHELSLTTGTAGSPYATSFRRFYWVR